MALGFNNFAMDVWMRGLNAQLSDSPLIRSVVSEYPDTPPGEIVWFRMLPDHEIDMEVCGEWVPVEDEWENPWE